MSAHTPHVLLVDDEPLILKSLEYYLGDQGMTVGCALDAASMDRYLAEHAVDLMVLDLVLPGEDGLAITRRLRAAGNTLPIIMLSSFGKDVDRIVGLEVGVDDYLPKPANPRELLARIRAVLRRRQSGPGEKSQDSRIARFGPFCLNLDNRSLTRDGQPVGLTSAEFDLLKLFVSHPEQELNRDQLMEALKGYEHTPFDRTMDVRVKRLRGKLEDDPRHPRYIRTVWGKGYVFTPRGGETA